MLTTATETKAPKRSPQKHGFCSCCASRRRPKGGRRIADSIAVGHPEGAQREAARSQILFVLCIQKAPKGRPPDRRFYSCCASRRRPKGGAGGRPAAPSGSCRSTDSFRVVHPEGAQTQATRSQILVVICIQHGGENGKSVLPMQGRVLPHDRGRPKDDPRMPAGNFATVLGTGEIGPSTDSLQPLILTTISGIEAILKVKWEGGW